MYVADHRKANDGLRSVTYSDCGYAHDKPPATSLNSCVTRRNGDETKSWPRARRDASSTLSLETPGCWHGRASRATVLFDMRQASHTQMVP